MTRTDLPRRTPPAAKAAAPPVSPGDEAVPGTPGTAENLCPVCSGNGKVNGVACTNCGGTGRVNVGLGGA